MSVQQYREKLIDIRENIIDYIRNEESSEIETQQIIQYLDDQKLKEKRYELNDFLRFIVQLVNTHQRTFDFFTKIEKILNHYKDDIKQTFTNNEIFNIFERNKHLLLYLIKEGILTIDNRIANIFTKDRYKKFDYPSYFWPEIKPFITDDAFIKNEIKQIDDEEFEEKRKTGENDSYITKLIRNDEIDDFISFMTRNSIYPSSNINHSIFETNLYLLKHETSIIEYAAFFGSVEIFTHLYLIGAEVDSNLWFYVIHSGNPNLIHSLEEKGIKPKNEYYRRLMIESIVCHHNEIAEYFETQYIQKHLEIDFYIISKSIHHHNYFFFPEDFDKDYLFWKFLEYGYESFCQMILNNYHNIDINSKIESKIFFIY